MYLLLKNSKFILHNKYIIFPFIITLITGIVFFGIIKYVQIIKFDFSLLNFYPTKFFLYSVSMGVIFLFTIWFSFSLFLSYFSRSHIEKILFQQSISNLYLLLGPILYFLKDFSFLPEEIIWLIQRFHPLQLSTFFYLFGTAIVFYRNIKFSDLIEKKQVLFIFSVITIFIFITIPSLSPFYHYHFTGWSHYWEGMQGDTHFPIEVAGQYSLPWLDTFALGAYPAYFSTNLSWSTSIISIIFGISPIDIIGRILIFKYTCTFLAIFGSFGFYLFCKNVLSFGIITSLIGSLLFLPSNLAILKLVEVHQLAFWSTFFIAPISLYLLHKAQIKNNLIISLFAGAILTSSIYINSPHADVLLPIFLYLIIPISIGIVYFFNTNNSLRFKHISSYVIGGFSAGALYFFPILTSFLNGETAFFLL